MATAKKNAPAKKTQTKKSEGGSNLDDMSYTKQWHDKKIVEYSAKLAEAKVNSPNLVKSIKEDISWLKNSRRNSVKVAPRNTGGGSPGASLSSQSSSVSSSMRELMGGGLRKSGR
jgi:hypothetical protein